MFRIAWRLQRVGLLGMSAFGVFYGVFQSAAYRSAAGSTAASRAAFGHQMATFGQTLTFLLPTPVRLDTVSGYIQWRVYGALPFLFGIWALMAAAGASRGDEERGMVEEWLASPLGRGRYIAVRFLAFAAVAAIAVGLTSAAIDLGVIASGLSLDLGSVVEETVALLAVTLTCYGISMALAQVVAARSAAAGLAGTVLAVLFFMNSFSRTVENLRPVARVISPFYYFDRSTPLTPGGSFDMVATAGLLISALILAGLSAWLMSIRDLGSPLFERHRHIRPATHVPSPNRLLRIPVISSLYEQRVSLMLWTVGTLILAAYVASIGRSVVNLAKGSGGFHAYLTLVGHGNPYAALTGYFWIGTFQLALVAFALVRVAKWSSDDNEGRLEMQLSAPVARWWVVGERSIAFLAAAIVVVAASSAAFYVAAAADAISLPTGDLVVASLALIPFVLSFAAVGAVLTSYVPRAAIAVLSALAFSSYLITEGGPLLKWPDGVMKLSAFSLYGTPFTNGVYWTGLWILIGITVAGFGLAALLMQQREVGR